jgi:hypothetical protein
MRKAWQMVLVNSAIIVGTPWPPWRHVVDVPTMPKPYRTGYG